MKNQWAAIVMAMAAAVAVPAAAQMQDDLKLGYQAYKSGNFDAAASSFGKAIASGQLDRDALAVTLNNRGVSLSQLGDYDGAIADYLSAQQLKPDDATTRRNLRFAYATRGYANANLGENAKALEDYGQSLAVDPDYVLALQRRGSLRVQLGDRQGATADFQKVLALEPGNTTALAALTTLTPPAAGPAAPAPVEPAPTAPAPAASEPAVVAAAPDPAPEPTPPQPAKPAAPVVAEPAPAATPPVAAAPPVVTAPPPAPEPPAVAAVSSGQRFKIRSTVNLRGGPGNDYPRTGSVAGGVVLDATGESQGWYRFNRSNGGEGWIYKKWLQPVE